MTPQIQNAKLPTHLQIHPKPYPFHRHSLILLQQIPTIHKHTLTHKITHLHHQIIHTLHQPFQITLPLIHFYNYTSIYA
ncbi:type II toxin-antitoxin system PemK/MazF family toxin, partial [Priestia megaterium]|uniref:type II toxin-antitoxin system PemK/MazF family toxin n=1 Tax=Priestia megaterium TaxID=1404 RepID=UPI0037096B97